MYNVFLPPELFDDEEDEIPPTQKQATVVTVQKEEKITEYKCVRCKDWFTGVEPNQEDGKFKCYLCRQDPYR